MIVSSALNPAAGLAPGSLGLSVDHSLPEQSVPCELVRTRAQTRMNLTVLDEDTQETLKATEEMRGDSPGPAPLAKEPAEPPRHQVGRR